MSETTTPNAVDTSTRDTRGLPSEPSVIYVCIASADAVNPVVGTLRNEFLKQLADLTTKYRQHVFISPSLANYTLLPWITGDISPAYSEWKDRCRLMLTKCDHVLVLDGEGTAASEGVNDEIELAIDLGKLVYVFSDLAAADA